MHNNSLLAQFGSVRTHLNYGSIEFRRKCMLRVQYVIKVLRYIQDHMLCLGKEHFLKPLKNIIVGLLSHG